jgi:pimeloyl-ACP methyl ester carboxylesterase
VVRRSRRHLDDQRFTAGAACDVRGIHLAYEIAAPSDVGIDGVPLVWGHGLLSSRDTDDRTRLVDFGALRARRPVVRYDAVGHGSSAPADDVARYRWTELADDQLALVAHLAVDRYIAGGESMGAATALLAAMKAPERVAGLVLVTPPCAWHTRPAQAEAYLQGAQLIDDGHMAVLAEFIAGAPPPGPFVGDPTWPTRAAAAADALASQRSAVSADVLRGAANSDLPLPADLTERLTMPTLILCWTDDDGHPASTGEALAAAITGARLVVSSRASEVAGWSAQIADFVASIDP